MPSKRKFHAVMERTGWLYKGGERALVSASTPLQYYDVKLQSNLTVLILGVITVNGAATPSAAA